MQHITGLFRAQSKIIIASVMFAVLCLCIIPLTLPNPKPTSKTISTTRNILTLSPKETSIINTPTEITPTLIIPTNTISPTKTLVPTATLLSTPTSIQIARGTACIPNNVHQTGKVLDVVDGDTIKVLLDQDGKTYSIRYIGVDTPEYTSQVEYFGAEAAVKNVQLVLGKTVTLIKDVSETDIYGRLLRYVLVDDIFVNYELVAQGFANVASFPPDIACIPTFREAEQEASTGKIGLWNTPPTLEVVPITGSTDTSGTVPCNCGGSDLDCGDFSSHASAQSCYNYCKSLGFGDIFRLDGSDNDGLACESLP